MMAADPAIALAARAAATAAPSTIIDSSGHADTVHCLIAALRDLMKPLQKLDALVSFEAMRQDAHPLLPPLKTIATEFTTALAANLLCYRQQQAALPDPLRLERWELKARVHLLPGNARRTFLWGGG